MTRGVHLGGSDDVGERIVVVLNHKLPQLIHHRPLQGQELKFVHGVVLLVLTHVGNRP